MLGSKSLMLIKDCVDNLLIDYPEFKNKPLIDVSRELSAMIKSGENLMDNRVSATPKKKVLKKVKKSVDKRVK